MVRRTQVKAVVMESHNALEVDFAELGVADVALELWVAVKKVEEMAVDGRCNGTVVEGMVRVVVMRRNDTMVEGKEEAMVVVVVVAATRDDTAVDGKLRVAEFLCTEVLVEVAVQYTAVEAEESSAVGEGIVLEEVVVV